MWSFWNKIYLIKNSFWKFYEVRSERGDFNWCRFWASWVCTYFFFRLALAILWFYALWDVKNTKSCGKFMVNSPENPSCIHTRPNTHCTPEAFRHIFINSWFASYWPFILGKTCLLTISFDISESFIEQKVSNHFMLLKIFQYDLKKYFDRIVLHLSE